MKIVADQNMAVLAPLFSSLGSITALPGRRIDADSVKDADLLFVRSITQVDKSLIEAAAHLQFVGTATIGTDHLDLVALDQKGISWSNAPGCNAEAVGEYVLTALLLLAQRTGSTLAHMTVGIIGAGNTGTAVGRRLNAIGMTVKYCDPPRQAQAAQGPWYNLETLLAECDVVSLHVPLSDEVENTTRSLLNAVNLPHLKNSAWLVNASRGEVIDNQALLALSQQRNDIRLVLDVWDGEPNPLMALVERADIATPHIAGYSVEGKIRGSLMLRQAMSDLCPKWYSNTIPTLAELILEPDLPEVKISGVICQQGLTALALGVYDLEQEDQKFRQALPEGFDERRQAHLARREFMAQPVQTDNDQSHQLLVTLGFNTNH